MFQVLIFEELMLLRLFAKNPCEKALLVFELAFNPWGV